MITGLKSPGSYLQGQNILSKLYRYLNSLGEKAMFVISPSGHKRHGADIISSLEEKSFNYCFEIFKEECCVEEINRLCNTAKENKADILVGVGGGKILDTVKAVGFYTNLPVVIIPTVASTDAPCSALSVLYKKDGTFDKYLFLNKSHDVVLVDTQIIANAPAALLAAGMGDAFATYYEARAVRNSGSTNQIGMYPTEAAFALASKCNDILLEYGEKAYYSVKQKEVSDALAHIVEANIYLSGVGFESGGLAVAHALQKGLTILPKLHHKLHGEKVAFSTLVQLCLENSSDNEIRNAVSFLKTIDLPTDFKSLGAEGIRKDEWKKVAEFTCRPGMTTHNMPFEVSADILLDAIYRANEIGENRII